MPLQDPNINMTNASVPVTGTFWQATQPISGTITANAGTNLNTSALALETGGNLATIAGSITSSVTQTNIKQMNGITTAMGNGTTNTGTQRVTLSSDSTGQVALVSGTTVNSGQNPAGTSLNTYSIHLTANGTTTPTSSTAYISSITISNEVGGTTSTITIQDKQGTPLKLINGIATTALTTAPTVVNFQTPVKMVSGIDIITAGAVVATVDVWINYFQ